jgi:hypothetical protein
MKDYKAEAGIPIPERGGGNHGRLARTMADLEVGESMLVVMGEKDECQRKQVYMTSSWNQAMRRRSVDRTMTTRIYQIDGGTWVLRLWRIK